MLCPDHLIDKWCRELMNWIPHASIIRFGPGDNGTGKISPTRQALRDTLELTERFSAGSYVKVLSNGVRQERKCRAKPAGNEWVVLGKNQVKYASEWLGLTDIDSSLTQRPIIGWALKSDEPVYCCPRCGSVVVDKDGDPVDAKKLSKKSTKKFCEAILLKAQPNATRPDLPGGQWIVKPTGLGTCRDGDLVPLYGRTWVAYKCREALYTYTAKPYRWAPANLIHAR